MIVNDRFGSFDIPFEWLKSQNDSFLGKMWGPSFENTALYINSADI